MARVWTEEQKQRQRGLIHSWQPWNTSTGAKTIAGKETSKMNAKRFYLRKHRRLGAWLARVQESNQVLTPEFFAEYQKRADKLNLNVELSDSFVTDTSIENAKVAFNGFLGDKNNRVVKIRECFEFQKMLLDAMRGSGLVK